MMVKDVSYISVPESQICVQGQGTIWGFQGHRTNFYSPLFASKGQALSFSEVTALPPPAHPLLP